VGVRRGLGNRALGQPVTQYRPLPRPVGFDEAHDLDVVAGCKSLAQVEEPDLARASVRSF